MPFQNASSRLTLVLRPATTIEGFAMDDAFPLSIQCREIN